MKMKSERGAVIIEATLSVVLFMFAILTVYTMFHVSLAQSRISSALNSVAKEISQYSYIYDLTGLNDAQADLAGQGGAAESVLSDNLSEVETFYDAIGGITDTAMDIVSSPDNAESFLYYTLNAGVEEIKGQAVGAMAKGLMKKHFGSNPDKYLRQLGIEDGLSGLSFRKTRVFANGEEDLIIIDVRYKVKVVKLLNIDMEFNYELCAKTRAWIGED